VHCNIESAINISHNLFHCESLCENKALKLLLVKHDTERQIQNASDNDVSSCMMQISFFLHLYN